MLTSEELRQFQNIKGAIGMSGLLNLLAEEAEKASDTWSKSERVNPQWRAATPMLAGGYKQVSAELSRLAEKVKDLEAYFYK